MCDYGVEGYGRYWIIIEIMRESKDYKIKTNKMNIRGLSAELQCSFDKTSDFVKDCIEEYELFETDGEYIWSNSLLRRMTPLDNRRSALQEAGKKGAAARWGDTEAKEDEAQAADNAVIIDDDPPSDPPPEPRERIPYEDIKNLYNLICKDLPEVKLLSDKRKTMIKSRVATLRQVNLTFEDYFKYVASSKFLNGGNKENWKANFDWILNSTNAIKILEGNYNDRTKPKESNIENGNIFFNIANIGGLTNDR